MTFASWYIGCYSVICIQRAFSYWAVNQMNQQRACLQMRRAVFLRSHISPVLGGPGGHVFLWHWRNTAQTGRCFSKWKVAVKINDDSSAENSKQKLWEIHYGTAFVVANGASVNNPASQTGSHRVWDGRRQQPAASPHASSQPCCPTAAAAAAWAVGFPRGFLLYWTPLFSRGKREPAGIGAQLLVTASQSPQGCAPATPTPPCWSTELGLRVGTPS